jgi:BRCT domain type II-containing protein
VKTPKAKTKATKNDKESNGDSATRTTSKKKIVPEGDAGSLTGQTLASTGTLRTLDRSTFEQTVLKFGGTFTSKIAEASSIVLGEKPGDKKLEEINGKGYSTITEDEFYDLIGADFAPPAKRAKKE